VSGVEESLCDSDSEEQNVSDDSDVEDAGHLSENSNNSVLTDQ
jgi:hypothetical protein